MVTGPPTSAYVHLRISVTAILERPIFEPPIPTRNSGVEHVKDTGRGEVMSKNAELLISMAREAFVGLTAAEEEFFRRNAEDQIPNFCVGPEENNDPANADRWGPDRTIRADCVRWLCVTTEARPLIIGNRIRAIGAKIEGALQLDYSTIDFVVAFRCCAFTGKISFEGTTLRSLDFWGANVKSIYAAGMKTSGSVHFWNGFVAVGQVNLDLANISGNLICKRSRFIFKERPDDVQFPDKPHEAFRASGLEVKGIVSFNGSDVRGAVCLYQANIDGNLSCDGSHFINKGRNALLATGAKIGGAVYLAREFFAFGQVNLEFTEIGGSLNCECGFFLHHRFGIQDQDAQEPALNLESSDIRGSVYLTNGFLAIGKVNLLSVIVRGHLDCGGGHFLNQAGYALLCDNAQISNSILLRNDFFAAGEVRLFASNISGNLECNGGQFVYFSGNAINAERADISGHHFLNVDKSGKPFIAKGNIILRRMEVGGTFSISNVVQPENIKKLDIRFAKVTVLEPARNSWPKSERLQLDGLVYSSLGPSFLIRVRHEISVSNISCIWTNCIVPFSVERVGTNIYFFNLFVCYLGSWRVGVGVEFGPHL